MCADIECVLALTSIRDSSACCLAHPGVVETFMMLPGSAVSAHSALVLFQGATHLESVMSVAISHTLNMNHKPPTKRKQRSQPMNVRPGARGRLGTELS